MSLLRAGPGFHWSTERRYRVGVVNVKGRRGGHQHVSWQAKSAPAWERVRYLCGQRRGCRFVFVGSLGGGGNEIPPGMFAIWGNHAGSYYGLLPRYAAESVHRHILPDDLLQDSS